MIKKKYKAEIEEIHPENPEVGAEIWRLISWVDEESVPCFEVYRSVIIVVEDGDLDTGPSCYLAPGDFEQVGGGIGYPCLEQHIYYYHNTEQQY